MNRQMPMPAKTAPVSTTVVTATSDASSVRDNRDDMRVPDPPGVCVDATSLTRVARHPGQRPPMTATPSPTTMANTTTRESNCIETSANVPASVPLVGKFSASVSVSQRASTRPVATPAAPYIRLSTRKSRVNLHRDAPRAARVAISADRATPRVSSRCTRFTRTRAMASAAPIMSSLAVARPALPCASCNESRRTRRRCATGPGPNGLQRRRDLGFRSFASHVRRQAHDRRRERDEPAGIRLHRQRRREASG